MYNNVGHATVRGTGTNGYIQRNFAFLPKERERPIAALQQAPQAQKPRRPNKKLLARQSERAIESKVYDLQCELEDKGIKGTLIKIRCDELREKLKIKVANGESIGGEEQRDSHRIAALQHQKNELLRKALGIGSQYKRGTGFDREAQEERKNDRLQERLEEVAKGPEDPEKTKEFLEGELKKLDVNPLDRRYHNKRSRDNENNDSENPNENQRKNWRRNNGDNNNSRGGRRGGWSPTPRPRERYRREREERRRGGGDRERDRGRRDRRRDSDRGRRRDDRRNNDERRPRKRGRDKRLESPSPPVKRQKRSESRNSPSNSAEARPGKGSGRGGGRWMGGASPSISGEREFPERKSVEKKKKDKKYKASTSKKDEKDTTNTAEDDFDKELAQHLQEQEKHESMKRFSPKSLQVVDSAPDLSPTKNKKVAKEVHVEKEKVVSSNESKNKKKRRRRESTRSPSIKEEEEEKKKKRKKSRRKKRKKSRTKKKRKEESSGSYSSDSSDSESSASS